MKLFTALATAAVALTGFAAPAEAAPRLNATFIDGTAYYCYRYTSGDAVCGATTPYLYNKMQESLRVARRYNKASLYMTLSTGSIDKATAAINSRDLETACSEGGLGLSYARMALPYASPEVKSQINTTMGTVKKALTMVCTDKTPSAVVEQNENSRPGCVDPSIGPATKKVMGCV